MIHVIFQVLMFGACCKAYVNLALNRPAWQESDYSPDWGADKAVDGRYSDRSAGGNQCTISANGKSTATLRVDLQSVVSISHINIFYRTDNAPSPGTYSMRFAGFFLYVSNTTSKDDGYLCFHQIQDKDGTPTENQTISCPVHGRYVIYYNERGNPDVTYPSYYSQYAFNELCELEAYGCHNPKFYGETCAQPCPEKCQEQNCDISGHCLGCIPGYQDPRCSQKCSKQKFGLGCSVLCGNCSNGETCHHVNGTCLSGCNEGAEGDKCQAACIPGFYDRDCRYTCSDNCGVPNRCDKFTGECDRGCQRGWKGGQCDQKCDGGMYGANCNQNCGHCLDDEHCDHINGTCEAGCSPGYDGSLCDDNLQETGFTNIYENTRLDDTSQSEENTMSRNRRRNDTQDDINIDED
ncbi:multiple epidermal growth factor-like domains protein 10 [Saccostrea echinata]|uniref:multiple epidermal growth factor-like domains protein 10 n=1 Tax=Saccostrea echinata TaxID=191078 RepID=UPI002A83C682|nr:multiple epidermal growth factor-like domains protein 10 [Saccostrea echinata]